MNTKQLIKYIENNELEIDAKVDEGNITGLRNAIILAKEFAEQDSHKFVNGVLDKVVKSFKAH